MSASTKRKANVYREAARAAEQQVGICLQGACLNIRDIIAPGTFSRVLPECVAFRAVFDTEATHFKPLIWGFDPEDQDQRILALCFMAAMVETGDA